MSSTPGLSRTPRQRPPLRRGVKEALVAVAALPVLLAVGVYVGGRIGDTPSTAVATPSTAVGTPATATSAPAPSPVAPVARTIKPPAPAPTIASPPGPVAPAVPPAPPRAVLARGSTGVDVRTWQRQMARRGWRIKVDGIFGPQTASVARRFQREKGLRVDALVGPRTWAAAWRRPVT